MKVSIVTPSFNQGEFIERTLQSVAIQRDSLPLDIELEHVIFDGGSTDTTIDVLQNFTPKITWVSEKDNGQAHAVNKGIESTNGDIIGWINSDDIYYPGIVKRVVDFFIQHPDIDVVYGMAYHINKLDIPYESYPSEPWDFERLKDICFICQPALFFRRRILKSCGLLDESLKYCMDYEFWLRLSKHNIKFAYIKEYFAGSRMYSDNKTLSSRVAVHREINDMLKTHFKHVPERWIINYAHAVVEQTVIREKTPYKFIFKLFTTASLASYKWNRRILPMLQVTFIHWGKNFLLDKLRA